MRKWVDLRHKHLHPFHFTKNFHPALSPPNHWRSIMRSTSKSTWRSPRGEEERVRLCRSRDVALRLFLGLGIKQQKIRTTRRQSWSASDTSKMAFTCRTIYRSDEFFFAACTSKTIIVARHFQKKKNQERWLMITGNAVWFRAQKTALPVCQSSVSCCTTRSKLRWPKRCWDCLGAGVMGGWELSLDHSDHPMMRHNVTQDHLQLA